jgi:hypothetical protein
MAKYMLFLAILVVLISSSDANSESSSESSGSSTSCVNGVCHTVNDSEQISVNCQNGDNCHKQHSSESCNDGHCT